MGWKFYLRFAIVPVLFITLQNCVEVYHYVGLKPVGSKLWETRW